MKSERKLDTYWRVFVCPKWLYTLQYETKNEAFHFSVALPVVFWIRSLSKSVTKRNLWEFDDDRLRVDELGLCACVRACVRASISTETLTRNRKSEWRLTCVTFYHKSIPLKFVCISQMHVDSLFSLFFFLWFSVGPLNFVLFRPLSLSLAHIDT